MLYFTTFCAILDAQELVLMPNVKPVSDLRNYTEGLRDVEAGSPVFLTKNGHGRYAIVDMQDYERTYATLRLLEGLAQGRRSGETEGWLTPEEVRAHFEARAYEECVSLFCTSVARSRWHLGLHSPSHRHKICPPIWPADLFRASLIIFHPDGEMRARCKKEPCNAPLWSRRRHVVF